MSAYRDALDAGAKSLGIDVDARIIEAMEQHHRLVVKWAKRMNLTTVTDDEDAAIVHGLDCLLLAEEFTVEADIDVVDVGSGAGFPGIILAIARPKLGLTLMEPQRKRASFLRVALAELGRDDVSVTEERLEISDEVRWTANAIVSRATIPPIEMLKRARPHLAPGGRLYLMSGAGAPSLEALEQSGMSPEGRREYMLPGALSRVIDVLRR